MPRPRIVVLSGNPRPQSRTLAVGRAVAGRIDAAEPAIEIDLALLAHGLFSDTDGAVAEALAAVRGATALVVATPVYKGSYTGLLKVFLDQVPSGGLDGVTAVPVVVSAAPAHQAAGELYLRPLLLELGATVPARAFAVTEAQLPDLDEVLDAWAVTGVPLVTAASGVLHRDAAVR